MSAGKRPSRVAEIGEESRRRILDAAGELFAEKGFQQTTFDDIAERSGISRGSIPWHFENKQGLLVAVAARVFEPVGLDAEDDPEAIEDLDAYLQLVKRHLRRPALPLLYMLLGEAMKPDSPIRAHYRNWQRAARSRLAASIAKRVPPEALPPGVTLDQVAAIAFASVIGLDLQWRVDPRQVSLNGHLDALVVLLGALGGPADA